MGKSILITGGARSGKSQFAEQVTLRLGSAPIYIATAEAHDTEMAERIATHQARRGPEWTTVAAPLDLPDALARTDGAGPRLVDCLTLWLSNLMLAEQDLRAAGDSLAADIAAQRSPVVIVTNEVGGGIVPENALARRFRDAAGRLNQTVAAVADEVFLCVAGQPVRVKPNDIRF